MNENLKLAVLTYCRAVDKNENPPYAPSDDYLELTVCDVGALQAAAADRTRDPVALPHLRTNCKVRASRTFVDQRGNKAIVEELAARYDGQVMEGIDPFYWTAAFRVGMAERILPQYFLKPFDHPVESVPSPDISQPGIAGTEGGAGAPH